MAGAKEEEKTKKTATKSTAEKKTVAKKVAAKTVTKPAKKVVETKGQDTSSDVKAGSNTSVPVETYLSSGSHIGTKVKTKDMSRFTYKTNPNGLHILDVQVVDERIERAGKFLAKYSPDDILVVGRRENAWKPIKAFAKAVGAKSYTGRYPAGVLTNPSLKTFIEPKIILVTDPWTDKNAVHDAFLVGIPIIALCDTNNTLQNVDIAVPCNNKGAKSLGLVFWLLANYYLKERGELKGKELDKEPFSE